MFLITTEAPLPIPEGGAAVPTWGPPAASLPVPASPLLASPVAGVAS